MKLICSQFELNSALQLVSRAVASRPTHPVLANVLLTADEGTGKYTFTINNDMSNTNYNITSNGSGGTVNISGIGANGTLATIAVNGLGSGYCVGDLVGITTVTSGSGAGGYGAVLSVESISNTIDSMYLTNVQGEEFNNNQPVIHYVNDNRTSTASVQVNGTSIQLGELYSGKVFFSIV